jgi:hypothetical protein
MRPSGRGLTALALVFALGSRPEAASVPAEDEEAVSGAACFLPPAPEGEVLPSRSCLHAGFGASLSERCAPFDPRPSPPRRATKAPVLVTRARRAPFSAAPIERLVSLPPPAWTIGLRPTIFHVPDPARIEPHLRFFTENPRGRRLVTRWLRRSGRYRASIEVALQRAALPRDLAALVFVESGFSPVARSKAGAVGLWQLMRSTARDLGLHVAVEYDERRSVARSTDAATRHLSRLYARFGSWELAFAAYDCGARRLRQRMDLHDTHEYWTLASIPGALPQETVDYVPKIVAFAILLRNLDRFGFGDVVHDRPIMTTSIEVPPGTPFGIVARAAATSVRQIREINPAILGDAVPADAPVAKIEIPARGRSRARIMLPVLLEGSDGLELLVPDDFDWGRHQLDPKIVASGSPPNKAPLPKASDRAPFAVRARPAGSTGKAPARSPSAARSVRSKKSPS